MTHGIGHNGGPTFDDTVREGLDRGILLTIKEVIVEASRDPRCEKRHLRVLAEVVACINSQSGIAYPGRSTIAINTRKWNPSDGDENYGYTDAGISKTLSELVDFGYLVTVRRALENGGRALTLYAIRKPPVEDLAEHITRWVMAQRLAASSRKTWRPPAESTPTHVGKPTYVGGVRAESTNEGRVTAPESTHAGKVSPPHSTPVGNSTPVGGVRAESTSDSTYVDRTVTNGGTVRTEGGASAHARGVTYPPPNGGEEHAGHGVYVNGETIRHSQFVVSLSGIRMQTINTGLSANEVRDRCLAHALQWAAEIENGARPEKVLPSKISNFLSRSIVGEMNQAAIQKVREERARQSFGASVAGTSPPAVESRPDRIARLMREAQATQNRKA